jgi:Na+(H+)/acetate symporter ActP
MSRTTDAAEYYVAGRRVPAVYNGMATGADWMSAASFIGMAGTLYLTGYNGLAFIMGWTGGYCLVALFLAPYLRKFGQFTIPDFLGERYGGNLPRFVHRAPSCVVHLRGGADLRRGPDHLAPDRRGVRAGCSWAWAAFWCARSWAACAR